MPKIPQLFCSNRNAQKQQTITVLHRQFIFDIAVDIFRHVDCFVQNTQAVFLLDKNAALLLVVESEIRRIVQLSVRHDGQQREMCTGTNFESKGLAAIQTEIARASNNSLIFNSMS
ncbi:MAG: hypothetical protein MHMPM18_003594 [Marteilia pararefringens]